MKKYSLYTIAVLTAFALVPFSQASAETDSASLLGDTSVPTSSNMESSSQNEELVSTPLAESETLEEPTNSSKQEVEEESSERVNQLVESMSTQQKITQMIMPDFRKWQQEGEENPSDFTTVNPEVAEVIDKYDFGGAILFAENVKATEQTLELTQGLQEAAITNKANNGKIPLLLAIDQEGGIVYRLGTGTALPGNMSLGASDDPELSKTAGQIIGRELSSLGINVDFAPVLDTNNNPQNPVIGLRSFSSDPERVARLGIPMMKGIQEYNVAVAAKHFPGHGDTAVDSHTGLPLVDKSYDELVKLELHPFKAAIEQGVDMLMTAHIQYPQIEKETVVSKLSGETIYLPATLSDDVMTGIVRNTFGYNGIIVSDAMGMDAIAKNFGESDAAIMAIKAGVDIILMPTTLRNKADLAKIDTIITDIAMAVAKGDIPESRLDESVKRILKLKEKRGVLDFSLTDRTAKNALETVGSDLNRNLERKIAASGVTLVKNEDMVLPFKVTKGDKVVLLGAYTNELPGLQLGMRRLQADGVVADGVTIETIRYSKDTTIDSLKDKLQDATHIIVISEIGRESQLAKDNWLTKLPTDIIDYANNKNIKSVVMSISKPYDVANYPKAKAIIAVYGNKGMDPTESLKPDNAFGPNIPAGVEVIFGGLEHKGTLPVAIPMVKDGILSEKEVAYSIGHGLFYTDPVKEIRVTHPKAVKIGDTLTLEINLGDLKGLEKGNFQLIFDINQPYFAVVPSKEYQITGKQVVVNRHPLQTEPLSIYLKAVKKGEIAPISILTLIDQEGRAFSMGEGFYREQLSVLLDKDSKPHSNPDHFDKKEKKPTTTITDNTIMNAEKEKEPIASHLAFAKYKSNTQLPATGEHNPTGLVSIGILSLLFAWWGRFKHKIFK